MLGLKPVFHGHKGNLLTVLDCIQNVWIATVGLDRICGAFEGQPLAQLALAAAVTLR